MQACTTTCLAVIYPFSRSQPLVQATLSTFLFHGVPQTRLDALLLDGFGRQHLAHVGLKMRDVPPKMDLIINMAGKMGELYEIVGNSVTIVRGYVTNYIIMEQGIYHS